MTDKGLLSAVQLAEYFGIKPTTVRDARWRRRAGIPATRVGGRLLFKISDVERVIARGRELLEPQVTNRRGVRTA
jgi:Helix-turn-helix domain